MEVTGGKLSYTMTLDHSQFERSIKSAISDLNIMQGAVSNLAKGMAALASVEGIKSFATKAFEMRTFFQDAEAAMKVFLKSDEKAAEHLKELQSYAWYNVFDFTELVTASRQLQAFGTDVENVIPVIDKLSNIAAATNTPLQNLVSMYNKAKNAGHLDSRGVMTLGNMGVNVKETLKEMGEQADVTSISFKQLEKVIDHLTDKEAGGMFAGLMDEQFNNLSSLKGALEDSIDTLFADFGEDLQPLFEKILKGAQEFVAWLDDHRAILENISKAIITITGAYGIYKGALAAVTLNQRIHLAVQKQAAIEMAKLRMETKLSAAGVQTMSKAEAEAAAKTTLLKGAMASLNKVLSASVWTALIAMVIKTYQAFKEFADAQTRVGKAVAAAGEEARSSVEKERIEFNSLVDTLETTESNTDKYKNTLEKLQKKYPDFLKNLSLEKGALEDINALRERGNQLLDEQAAKVATQAMREEAYKQIGDASVKAVDNIATILQKGGMSMQESYTNARKLLQLGQKLSYESNNMVVNTEDAFGNNTVETVLRAYTHGGFKMVEDEVSKEYTDFLAGLEGQLIPYAQKFFGVTTPEKMGGLINDFIADFSNKYQQAISQLGGAEEYEAFIIEQSKKAASGNGGSEANITKSADIAKKILETTKKINELRSKSKTTGITDEEKSSLEEYIETLDSYKKQYKTLTGVDYDTIKKNAKSASKAARELKKSLQDLADHEYDVILDAEQRSIDNMEDGFEKEQRLRKLNHDKNIANIERWGREEIERYEEIDKEKWLATHKGKDEEDFYAQYAGISYEDNYKVISAMSQMRQDEDERMAKEEADALRQMLYDYGNYAAQKEAIDRKYAEDRKTLEDRLTKEISDEERQRINDAIVENKKMQARETFDLDIATIDATAYDTVADRMTAINEAYSQYIKSLRLAGATEAEIAAVKQQQVEAAGRIATINEQIASLESQKLVAIDENDTEEVKRLNAEIFRLKQQLEEIERQADSKSFSQSIKEWAKNLKASDIAGYLNGIGDALNEIGEASGNGDIKNAGEAINGIGNAVSNIAQGAATGGWIGAVIAAVGTIASEVISVIAENEKLKKAIKEAKIDKWVKDMKAEMDTSTIFGEDKIEKVNRSMSVIRSATNELNNLYSTLYNQKIDKTRQSSYANPLGFIENNVDTWLEEAQGFNANILSQENAMFTAAKEAWAKGYKGLEAYVLKTQDRSGFANFLGIQDKFSNLKDVIKELGYEMYDQYGNLNADALQAVLDTYEDLGQADRDWMEEAITYSEQYKEAMDNLASYLSDLFGNVVDTIVDQVFEGATDMEAIVSDVGKKMAKDLMKSMIMTTYFDGMQERMLELIRTSGGMTEEASAQVFGMFAQAMQNLEMDMPQWLTLADKWSQLFQYDTEASSIGAGTALASASQESIDLMNGQLNAMRTVQGRMESSINNILLEMRGFRGDMNQHWQANHDKLDQIIDNTSTSGLGRSLGAYFG